MVLYVLTGYRVLRIVYLDQLTGAHHTHTYLIMIIRFLSFACGAVSPPTPSIFSHTICIAKFMSWAICDLIFSCMFYANKIWFLKFSFKFQYPVVVADWLEWFLRNLQRQWLSLHQVQENRFWVYPYFSTHGPGILSQFLSLARGAVLSDPSTNNDIQAVLLKRYQPTKLWMTPTPHGNWENTSDLSYRRWLPTDM